MRSNKICKKNHFLYNMKIINHSYKYKSLCLYPFIQNVCTKSLLRIHSVQHYYRNASHRKDTTQLDKVKSLKLLERMTNIIIIFVLSTNAVCCIHLDKNKR